MRGRDSNAPPMIPLLDFPVCPSTPTATIQTQGRVTAGTADSSSSYRANTNSTCTCVRTSILGGCRTCSMIRSSSESTHSYPAHAYATPTRSSVCHLTSATRRACSSNNPYSSMLSTTSASSSSASHGRSRSRTWSGTSVIHGTNAAVAAAPHDTEISQEVQDHALIRGDLAWICRQRPQISGSISLQLNLNFARIKRYMLAFLYLILMSLCFNSAFQKILVMKEPFVFLGNSAKVDALKTSLSSGEIRPNSHVANHDLINQKLNIGNVDSHKTPPLSHKAGRNDEAEAQPIVTKQVTDNISNNIAFYGNTQNKNKQTRTAFYAKAGAKQPLYVQPSESVGSVTTSPSTTTAFFGLIGVIFLTSIVFVKGSQEAHARWIEVNRRWEQSRQDRLAIESLNTVMV